VSLAARSPAPANGRGPDEEGGQERVTGSACNAGARAWNAATPDVLADGPPPGRPPPWAKRGEGYPPRAPVLMRQTDRPTLRRTVAR
jgi:hypothetical protein